MQENTKDIHQAMIDVANETDLMLRAFLDDLKARNEHELNRMSIADDV